MKKKLIMALMGATLLSAGVDAQNVYMRRAVPNPIEKPTFREARSVATSLVSAETNKFSPSGNVSFIVSKTICYDGLIPVAGDCSEGGGVNIGDTVSIPAIMNAATKTVYIQRNDFSKKIPYPDYKVVEGLCESSILIDGVTWRQTCDPSSIQENRSWAVSTLSDPTSKPGYDDHRNNSITATGLNLYVSQIACYDEINDTYINSSLCANVTGGASVGDKITLPALFEKTRKTIYIKRSDIYKAAPYYERLGFMTNNLCSSEIVLFLEGASFPDIWKTSCEDPLPATDYTREIKSLGDPYDNTKFTQAMRKVNTSDKSNFSFYVKETYCYDVALERQTLDSNCSSVTGNVSLYDYVVVNATYNAVMEDIVFSQANLNAIDAKYEAFGITENNFRVSDLCAGKYKLNADDKKWNATCTYRDPNDYTRIPTNISDPAKASATFKTNDNAVAEGVFKFQVGTFCKQISTDQYKPAEACDHRTDQLGDGHFLTVAASFNSTAREITVSLSQIKSQIPNMAVYGYLADNETLFCNGSRTVLIQGSWWKVRCN